MFEKRSEISFGRFVGRWAERILLGAVVICAGTYAIDLATYFARGKPVGHVTVNRTLAVPLKGNKTEYDYEGVDVVMCSESIYPQAGRTPCWYLRRHSTQTDQL